MSIIKVFLITAVFVMISYFTDIVLKRKEVRLENAIEDKNIDIKYDFNREKMDSIVRNYLDTKSFILTSNIMGIIFSTILIVCMAIYLQKVEESMYYAAVYFIGILVSLILTRFILGFVKYWRELREITISIFTNKDN